MKDITETDAHGTPLAEDGPRCIDCKCALTEEEAATFTVCPKCWEKAHGYPRHEPLPLKKTPAPAAGVPAHKRVFEYDGAFRCLDCGAEWGALPGHPVMPERCARKPADQPPSEGALQQISETLSTKAKPEQINKRLFDLCRYQRSELLHSRLITEDEFSFLLWDCDLAQGAGSPSPRRLEDYDEVRAKLTALTRQLAERGWQPIETAPRDGTKFIGAWFARDGFLCASDAWFDTEQSTWRSEEGVIRPPTHWITQPPEPAGEGGKP